MGNSPRYTTSMAIVRLILPNASASRTVAATDKHLARIGRAMAEARPKPVDALAEFVPALEYDDLPSAVVRLVERCYVDTVGVTMAGAPEGPGEMSAAALGALGANDRGTATIVGHDWRGTPLEAAFVNGTAGHGLDFDDVAEPMSNHPSVTMVPALLAVGETVDATGRDLISAFVAGYETQYYLAAPIMPTHYEVGWHATATLGTFGATAGVANLLDLSVEQIRHALNIAASMPSGLKRNFGSDTKPMHAGMAARAGVTAALLAQEGFTADHDALGDDRGFLDLYTRPDGFDLDALPDLGDELGIATAGVHVKKYPCCYFTHTSIAAAAGIRDEHDLDPDDVASVTVAASQGAHDALHHRDPDTGLEAKFSMHYAVAAALATERVDLATFDDANVDAPDVQAVRERVTFDLDETLPYATHEATVRVETAGGQTYERTLSDPPGTADNPLSDAELREKFLSCATRRYGADRAETVHGTLDQLRSLADVAELTAHL